MKHQRNCQAEHLFSSMGQQITDSSKSWSAMDAYLKILDSCNCCTIRDCRGMLADGIRDDCQQQDFAFDNRGNSLATLIPKITLPPPGDDERTVSSLLALARAVPGSDCGYKPPRAPQETPQEQDFETYQVYGDRSALAQFLGWSVSEEKL